MSTTHPLQLAGHDLIADAAGALYWPAERALIVTDLHLEKASAFAAIGQPLPPYDTAETLDRLGDLIERHRPAWVICLGDSLHDDDAVARLASADRTRLALLATGRRWTWVAGNHDPDPALTGLGDTVAMLAHGGLSLVHDAGARRCGPTLCGHYHPKVRLRRRGALISRPCFATFDDLIVLPALGAFTGGLDVTDPAFVAALGAPRQVLATGKRRIYRFDFTALNAPQSGASVLA